MFDSGDDRPHEVLQPAHLRFVVVSIVEVCILIRAIIVLSLYPSQLVGSCAAGSHSLLVEGRSKPHAKTRKHNLGLFRPSGLFGIMATESVKTPLLAETIEPDDPTPPTHVVHGVIGSTPGTTNKAAPVVLMPTNRATSNANATPLQVEAGKFDLSSSAFSVLSTLVR